MYKVFFNDRKLILTDDFSKHFQINYGLFYKYRSEEELEELISIYQRLSQIKSLYVFHSDLDELREMFKKCFIQINAAGGLVRNRKGEYLLIYRRGYWDLPKGKLDPGEDFQTAAIREVKEECGLEKLSLQKQLISTYHTYPYKKGTALKKTTWFEMCYEGTMKPIPQKEEDIEEIRWVPEKLLKTYLDASYPTIRDVFVYFGILYK